MRETYINAIANSIRHQAGHLADFIENDPARTQKDELYNNIFLALTGILGAILHLEINSSDFADILYRLFSEDTGWSILATLEKWDADYRQGHKCP